MCDKPKETEPEKMPEEQFGTDKEHESVFSDESFFNPKEEDKK